MTVKRLSKKWPSSAVAFSDSVRLDLHVDLDADPVQTEMTPMQAIEIGLQLVSRGRDALKSIIRG